MNALTFHRALHSPRYREGYDNGRRDARNGIVLRVNMCDTFGRDYCEGYKAGQREAEKEAYEAKLTKEG